jgi:predicted DNA-binding protein YlxM (UPF0122 family)
LNQPEPSPVNFRAKTKFGFGGFFTLLVLALIASFLLSSAPNHACGEMLKTELGVKVKESSSAGLIVSLVVGSLATLPFKKYKLPIGAVGVLGVSILLSSWEPVRSVPSKYALSEVQEEFRAEFVKVQDPYQRCWKALLDVDSFLDPTELTTRDDLVDRKRIVLAAKQSTESIRDFLVRSPAFLGDKWRKAGLPESAVSANIESFRKSANLDRQLAQFDTKLQLLQSMDSVLDLYDKHWIEWTKSADNKISFRDPDTKEAFTHAANDAAALLEKARDAEAALTASASGVSPHVSPKQEKIGP